MYGKLPDRKDLLGHKLKVLQHGITMIEQYLMNHVEQERKYFDSGDYALSKAGKEPLAIGSEHPSPDTIPHSNPISLPGSSPVKESPLVSESDKDAAKQQ